RFLDPNGEESIEQTTLELFAALNLMAVEESLQDGTAAFFGIGLADGMAESLEELIRPGEEPPAGLLRGDPGGLPDELRDAYTAGVRTGDRLGNRIAATGSGVPVLILGQAKHTARHGVKAVKGLLSGDTEAFLKHGDKMFQPTPTITLITFIMTRPQVGHDDDDEDPEDE
ncbi:MAG: hypothetical protein ACYTDX_07820, partial [Planctomycetota bacterium]